VRIGNLAVESKTDGLSERRLHETVHAGKSLFQLHVIYVTYILPPSACRSHLVTDLRAYEEQPETGTDSKDIA
jgi:hypothetical protein